MLEHLHIKNVALIDKLEADFGVGLNVLSGETGAGKSIIIDSINFVLGERFGKDFIRTGETCAEVSAIITVFDPDAKEALFKTGVFNDVSETDEILLNRTLTDAGRSVCKINGKPVTAGMLKDVSTLLIDIHGQHEHQSLLNQSKHIELLDRFCGGELNTFKISLGEIVGQYKQTLAAIKSAEGEDSGNKDEKIAVYSYQIKEIEAAALKIGEEEELQNHRKALANHEKIWKSAGEAVEIIENTTESLWKINTLAKTLSEVDDGTIGLFEAIENICAQADDFSAELNKYFAGIEGDPIDINDVEERLDFIYRLKKKYGGTVEAVFEHLEKTREKLDVLTDSDGIIAKLNEEKTRLGRDALKCCEKISEARKLTAKKLESEIAGVLKDLGMKNALFEIAFEKKDGFNTSGYDRVEFMISPNPGEPLKPLSKIASGGEMSRVMLALKTALAGTDSIETFIFDEIDTGVSGRAAQQVAEKLALIGRKHQILCITHLAQIAAVGEANFLIEKKGNERAITKMSRLDDEQIVAELARLIGGAEITESTFTAAREMRRQADSFRA